MFSEVTYGLDELLEKTTVITENSKVVLDLTETSKDVTLVEMNSKTFGRCYSIQLSNDIVKQGISELEFIAKMNTYVYFHHPGQFLQQSKSKLYTFKGTFRTLVDRNIVAILATQRVCVPATPSSTTESLATQALQRRKQMSRPINT